MLARATYTHTLPHLTSAPRAALPKRRLLGVLRVESVEGGEKRAVRRGDTEAAYLTDVDGGFSLTQVSFGTILSPIGVGLMVFGFCAYFDFIPGRRDALRMISQ